MNRETERPEDFDLIPLDQIESPSEIEVVKSLLRSAGIPAFDQRRFREYGSGYGLRAHVFVRRADLEDANRVIREAKSHSEFVPDPPPPLDESPSLLSAIVRVLITVILGWLIYRVYGLMRRWFG